MTKRMVSNSRAARVSESELIADEQLCDYGMCRLPAVAVALCFVRDRVLDREIYIYEADLSEFEIVLPKGKLVCVRLEYRDVDEINGSNV